MSKIKKMMDGWGNAISNIGKRLRDKRGNNVFETRGILNDDELTQMYNEGGLTARIIDQLPNDMTRQWITIENDEENFILGELDDLEAQRAFNLALKWARLYRGSAILIGAMDGQDLDQPLNENRVKTIAYLRVYDATEISYTTMDFNQDPTSSRFGELEYVNIYPAHNDINSGFRVHTSRLLFFKGKPAPSRVYGDYQTRFFGLSVLNNIFEEISDLGISRGAVGNILQEFIIGKFKLKGLAEQILSGNESNILKRMEIINQSKSVINSVLLDAEMEDYTRDSANITGIPEVLDRLMMFVSSVSGYPVTLLFGRSAAGLNSTGDNEIRQYYDNVKNKQETDLRKPLQQLVDLINIINKNKVQDPHVKFNSLWQMTQKEELEIKKLQAEIDKLYVDSQILSPEEITEMRFVGGYTNAMKIDLENWDMSKEQREIQAQLQEELNKARVQQQAMQQGEEENEM